MKTTKKLFFTMAAFVALSVSFTSCDAINAAATKKVEVDAPAIEFNIGAPAAVAPQKVMANGKAEYLWLERVIELNTELDTELKKQGLSVASIKSLLVSSSEVNLLTQLGQLKLPEYQLGAPKLFINGKEVASSTPWTVYKTNGQLHGGATTLTYIAPLDITSLVTGKMTIKITSDKPAPTQELALKLVNKYKGEVNILE